jgi:hypothetical protein
MSQAVTDPTAVQANAVAVIDDAIGRLYDQLGQPSIDDKTVHVKIEQLIGQRQNLNSLALLATIDPQAQAVALKRLNAATASLNTAAGNIKQVGNVLNGATEVISALTSVIALLTAFV